jgi:iron complex transport system substrate-binding protein
MSGSLLRGAVLAAALASSVPSASAAEANRIVSVGGSLTEIVYALDAGDRLVAVDTTSTYPAEALRTKPNVGYMRALSAEGVLATAPDLILALEGSGPPPAVEVLRNASVPILFVPDRHSPEGIAEKIRMVAEALGKTQEGEALAGAVSADIAAIERAIGKIERPKRAIFLLSLAGGRPMAAGSGTAAAAILKLAGAENAVSGFQGYKQVSDEAVIAAAPDVVLTMANVGATLGPDQVFALPALAATPAGRSRALITLDGQYLLGFGLRTASAIRDLAGALYPGLRLAGSTSR